MRRFRLFALPWPLLLPALLLSGLGLLAITSATYDPDAAWRMGAEARAQLRWFGIALGAAALIALLRWSTWQQLTWPLYAGALFALTLLLVAADTALVPRIKGQANWFAIGSLRLQPVEFAKVAVLLACAKLCAASWFQPARLDHVLLALACAGIPAALVAKEDLGSALTFPALIVAMLIAAGLRVRHALLGLALTLAVIAAGIAALPRDGYQWKRIDAFLNPDAYAQAEGYQSERSVRAIGSGQLFGKGFAAGDQNRLGMVPEKHTDLVLSVIGEEGGFLGTGLLLVLIALFAAGGLWQAAQARERAAALFVVGLIGWLVGQAAINIAVATRLMPVTGVTLPFVSYGGSSLLAAWIAIGLACSAALDNPQKTTSSRL